MGAPVRPPADRRPTPTSSSSAPAPPGSSAAYWLARAGLDVAVLEKSAFPREKVCGDGLTPRGVKPLDDMGIDVSGRPAGCTRACASSAAGVSSRSTGRSSPLPDYSLVRRRRSSTRCWPATRRRPAPGCTSDVTVTDPLLDDAGRVVGVQHLGRRRTSSPAPAARSSSSGLRGLLRPARAVLGMASARTGRWASPSAATSAARARTTTTSTSSFDLCRPTGRPQLLPGYGWVFGMGDGTANVGFGSCRHPPRRRVTDHRALLRSWLDGTPEEWLPRGARRRPLGGAALPMGFNRAPHYRRGLLLAGDSAGTVNPFNGEGIATRWSPARMAAEARSRRWPAGGAAAETALAGYPARMRQALGGYHRLGMVFSRLIGNPTSSARDPARPAPPGAGGVPAQADGQPVPTADGDRERSGHRRDDPAGPGV